MLPLLLLASISTALGAAVAAAPGSTQQAVHQSANGEFISDHYPLKALKAGEQGKVGFRLTVEPDGSLGSCEITQTSGFGSLDNETCELIVSYARLQPARDSDGRAVRGVKVGYINWRLPEGATRIASTSANTMPKPDQIICKRTEVTGSLIAKTKQCMTRSEWARNQRNTQQAMERLQGVGNTNGVPPGQ